MSFTKLIDKIMDCDPFVRFAVIIDKDGNKVESRTKKGITNFLPSAEMDLSIQFAVNSWKFRRGLSQHVGKNQYVLAVYEKVRRVTIPVNESYILLVAFGNQGGQKDIVDRILAIIQGDYTKPITPGFQY